MQGQVLFAPINGSQVPFHISMIKNAVQPDPDRTATYLRLNFFTPGQTASKDIAPATSKLIEQHGHNSMFIKEMLYRSRESQRLTAAHRMIQELRKRFRQHAAKAAEEADLIPQEKLVKMRDQRIPRMADLTMRPFISGKKTTGTLEAHTNGLRFTSKKHEIVDIMYGNIKHSLFQPCENEVMVLIHFYLKNPVLVGRKKSQNVQFLTEVVDASVALDSARRSMYDPDELDEEQRERQLRKKLNEMYLIEFYFLVDSCFDAGSRNSARRWSELQNIIAFISSITRVPRYLRRIPVKLGLTYHIETLASMAFQIERWC